VDQGSASAAAFIWGICSLISQRDLGPLVAPAIVIVLSFLMFLPLTVLEMRHYSWLKEARHQFEVFEKLAIFPEVLREVAPTDGYRLYWPLCVSSSDLAPLICT